MYIYDQIDQQMVDERVAQFRDQTRRFIAGSLSDDDFKEHVYGAHQASKVRTRQLAIA